MESRPPQEPSRRPTTNGRKPNGAGGSPTPPWIWVFLIAVVGLITYMLSGKNETMVNYSPWFLEQVHADNIEFLRTDGLVIHGKLRKETQYNPPEPEQPKKVTRFITTFLSEDQIKPVVDELTNRVGKKAETPRIEGSTTQGANGLVWLSLLLPTVGFVLLVYLMMRRARDQFDGGILGSFVKSPAKRHDKSKQRTTFEEVAGLEQRQGRTCKRSSSSSRTRRSSNGWAPRCPRACC